MRHIFGTHNLKNVALSALTLDSLGVDNKYIQDILNSFTGSGRRLDLVFKNERILLYDDYAHHHTQIKYCLESLRQKYNNNEKIIAVLEPHLISRFTNNSREYIDYMSLADFPIIMKFFKSRESFKEIPEMSRYLQNTKITYIEDNDVILDQITNYITNTKEKIIIIVMGAGNSYKLTEKIKDSILQLKFS